MDNTVIDILVVTWICLTILYFQKHMRCITLEKSEHVKDRVKCKLKDNYSKNGQDIGKQPTEHDTVKHCHCDLFDTSTTGQTRHDTMKVSCHISSSNSQIKHRNIFEITESVNKCANSKSHIKEDAPAPDRGNLNQTTNESITDPLLECPTINHKFISNESKETLVQNIRHLSGNAHASSSEQDDATTITHIAASGCDNLFENPVPSRQDESNKATNNEGVTNNLSSGNSQQIKMTLSYHYVHSNYITNTHSNDSDLFSENESTLLKTNLHQSIKTLENEKDNLFDTTSPFQEVYSKQSMNYLKQMDTNLSTDIKCYDSGTFSDNAPPSHQSDSNKSTRTTHGNGSDSFSEYASSSQVEDSDNVCLTDMTSDKYNHRNPNSRYEKASGGTTDSEKIRKTDTNVNTFKTEDKEKLSVAAGRKDEMQNDNSKSRKVKDETSSATLRFFTRFFSFDDVRNLDDKHIFD